MVFRTLLGLTQLTTAAIIPGSQPCNSKFTTDRGAEGFPLKVKLTLAQTLLGIGPFRAPILTQPMPKKSRRGIARMFLVTTYSSLIQEYLEIHIWIQR